MHKRLLNQAVLRFTITPQSPLLIKSGREAGADPTLLDMNFVRIFHAGLGTETVYLPGSSLKGTLRSYAERIARTLGVRCCNPFDGSFCGKRFEKVNSAAERHKKACTACRLFGNTTLASRLRIADAYPTLETLEAANQTWQRDGVPLTVSRGLWRWGLSAWRWLLAAHFGPFWRLTTFNCGNWACWPSRCAIWEQG